MLVKSAMVSNRRVSHLQSVMLIGLAGDPITRNIQYYQAFDLRNYRLTTLGNVRMN